MKRGRDAVARTIGLFGTLHVLANIGKLKVWPWEAIQIGGYANCTGLFNIMMLTLTGWRNKCKRRCNERRSQSTGSRFPHQCNEHDPNVSTRYSRNAKEWKKLYWEYVFCERT